MLPRLKIFLLIHLSHAKRLLCELPDAERAIRLLHQQLLVGERDAVWVHWTTPRGLSWVLLFWYMLDKIIWEVGRAQHV